MSVKGNVFLGGIIGALGLALFAGSLLGAVYSFVLALVLSHIAGAEEEDLRARFEEAYIEYKKRVPKLSLFQSRFPISTFSALLFTSLG